MALNRYNHNTHPIWGHGFDDFVVPASFPCRDPFDLMPVLPNLLSDDDFKLLRASPGYEITESEGKYKIAVDVQGVKAADMTVKLEKEGRLLHIVGGRKIEKEREMTETRFYKRFAIGENVDTDKLEASLEDGVLVLTAPKIEEAEKPGRVIPVKEGIKK